MLLYEYFGCPAQNGDPDLPPTRSNPSVERPTKITYSSDELWTLKYYKKKLDLIHRRANAHFHFWLDYREFCY